MVKILYENFYHFIKIDKILNGNFSYGCGSYLFDGREYKYNSDMFKKQDALFKIGKLSTRALEVGVYLGHSLLILLLSNPDLIIDCIDNDSRFSPIVVDYLNSNFNNRVKFYLGNANETLEKMTEKYDLIHIDADHNEEAVAKQFELSLKCCAKNAYIVFDDYFDNPNCINNWISNDIIELIYLPNCKWTNIVTKLKN
jgi:hypothetical protein